MKRKKKSRKNKSGKNVMTLCDGCARDYYNSPDFYIRAIYPRTVKESCTKCNRKGFDYKINPKKQRRNADEYNDK